jgi:hypothetical protein
VRSGNNLQEEEIGTYIKKRRELIEKRRIGTVLLVKRMMSLVGSTVSCGWKKNDLTVTTSLRVLLSTSKKLKPFEEAIRRVAAFHSIAVGSIPGIGISSTTSNLEKAREAEEAEEEEEKEEEEEGGGV